MTKTLKNHINCSEMFNQGKKNTANTVYDQSCSPILNPTGNYIHTAVSEHFLTSNHSDNHMLLIPIEKLKMGGILSGKHAKLTLSIKLRQLSL